jgi:hypothetical protein
MAVLGNNTSFFQQHSRQHNFLAHNELALQERVQILEWNPVPGDVLQLCLGSGVFSDGALRTRMRLRVLCFGFPRSTGRLGFDFFRHD